MRALKPRLSIPQGGAFLCAVFAPLLLTAGCNRDVHEDAPNAFQPRDSDTLRAAKVEVACNDEGEMPGDSKAFYLFREDLQRAVETGDTSGLAERVNVRSAGGETALIWYATENDLDCVTLLLSLGADTELEYTGKTALMIAAFLGYVEMTQLLLDNGASVSHQSQVDGQSAIHLAATNGKPEIVSLLRSYGAPLETLDCYGASPLMDCASSDMKAAVDQLLELGADPFFRNSRGQTALHVAAIYGTEAVYERLNSIDGLAKIEDDSEMLAADYRLDEFE